jgi:hypothetical protein
MAFSTITDGLSDNSNLHRRFQGALVMSAGEILTEDPLIANHANRLIWANNVVVNPMLYLADTALRTLKIAFVVNGQIRSKGNDATDNQIESAVTEVLASPVYLASIT